MNVSHNNATKDNAGSDALFELLVPVNLLWFLVFSWIPCISNRYYLDKKGKRISRCSPSDKLTEAIKYLNAKRRVKMFVRVWSFINFAILWFNISLFIYCLCDRNCDINNTIVSISFTLYPYLIQLGQSLLNLPGSDCLQEELLLIYRQNPVIAFTATCYHEPGDYEDPSRVEVHTEVSFKILGFH